MKKLNHKKSKLVYSKLLKHFGPQHWWPGDSPFEIMVGAILTQNTNWANVEKAITNLKKAKALSLKKIVESNKQSLERWVKPSGYFRVKAKKLKIFCSWLLMTKNITREGLLQVWGIGPETADSILCYALNKPSFVVDAYTRRIGQRVGLFKTSDYHEIKEFFESNLPRSLKLYQEYHALLVALGKDYCKPKPQCASCPIKKYCKLGKNV